MALIKDENIIGDFDQITYIRAKTKDKLFSIKITPPLREILIRFYNAENENQDYVFPILSKDNSKYQVHETITNNLKRQNVYLKRITSELGLPPFAIYTARHT
ncbi:hypothetical protein [Pricia sp.]|uniref:hypothetical protein n=1 Tax=Pricia sp. TaxID=2268138 RepID=UPI003593BC81